MKKPGFLKNHNIVFILLLLLASVFYNYHSILFYGPYSIHQWRQADCLSISMNYYQDNLNFFEPEVHWIGEDGHGKTVSEFPIIYYTVASLWKVFGHHEFIFRLFNTLIVFSGLFCLFRFSRSFLEDRFWGTYIPFFLFASPLLVYYTNNFISDTPALGLAMVAGYFFWKYYSKEKNMYFFLSLFFFLLAALIKITALMLFLSLLATLTVKHVLYLKRNRDRLKHFMFIQILPSIVAFIVIYFWYSYAKSYNMRNINGIFLQDIFPIWELNSTQIIDNLKSLGGTLLPSFYPIIGFLMVISMFLFSLYKYKYVNRFLLSTCIFLAAGIFIYLLLWFKALDVHDYYLTNLLIFIPLPLIIFLKYLKDHKPEIFSNRRIKLIAASILIAFIYNAGIINRMKYDSNAPLVRYSFIKKNKDYWNWYHHNYSQTFKPLETLNPVLKEAGIGRTDKIISIPDNSINISLYLMNQKGFTDFGYNHLQGEERIKQFIKYGAKYLVINNPALLQETYLQPYLQNKVGSYQHIEVYRLTE
jgi:hypothetical protein